MYVIKFNGYTYSSQEKQTNKIQEIKHQQISKNVMDINVTKENNILREKKNCPYNYENINISNEYFHHYNITIMKS